MLVVFVEYAEILLLFSKDTLFSKEYEYNECYKCNIHRWKCTNKEINERMIFKTITLIKN